MIRLRSTNFRAIRHTKPESRGRSSFSHRNPLSSFVENCGCAKRAQQAREVTQHPSRWPATAPQEPSSCCAAMRKRRPRSRGSSTAAEELNSWRAMSAQAVGSMRLSHPALKPQPPSSFCKPRRRARNSRSTNGRPLPSSLIKLVVVSSGDPLWLVPAVGHMILLGAKGNSFATSRFGSSDSRISSWFISRCK